MEVDRRKLSQEKKESGNFTSVDDYSNLLGNRSRILDEQIISSTCMLGRENRIVLQSSG
jgi:hypothetical protein